MPGQVERKLACSALRKVGTAVVRNRHRRKLKEFYRLNKHLWREETHFFCLFRAEISDWKDFEHRLSERLKSL